MAAVSFGQIAALLWVVVLSAYVFGSMGELGHISHPKQVSPIPKSPYTHLPADALSKLIDDISKSFSDNLNGLDNGNCDIVVGLLDELFPSHVTSHCQIHLGRMRTAHAKAAFQDLRAAQATDAEIAWVVSASQAVRKLSSNPSATSRQLVYAFKQELAKAFSVAVGMLRPFQRFSSLATDPDRAWSISRLWNDGDRTMEARIHLIAVHIARVVGLPDVAETACTGDWQAAGLALVPPSSTRESIAQPYIKQHSTWVIPGWIRLAEAALGMPWGELALARELEPSLHDGQYTQSIAQVLDSRFREEVRICGGVLWNRSVQNLDGAQEGLEEANGVGVPVHDLVPVLAVASSSAPVATPMAISSTLVDKNTDSQGDATLLPHGRVLPPVAMAASIDPFDDIYRGGSVQSATQTAQEQRQPMPDEQVASSSTQGSDQSTADGRLDAAGQGGKSSGFGATVGMVDAASRGHWLGSDSPKEGWASKPIQAVEGDEDVQQAFGNLISTLQILAGLLSHYTGELVRLPLPVLSAVTAAVALCLTLIIVLVCGGASAAANSARRALRICHRDKPRRDRGTRSPTSRDSGSESTYTLPDAVVGRGDLPCARLVAPAIGLWNAFCGCKRNQERDVEAPRRAPRPATSSVDAGTPASAAPLTPDSSAASLNNTVKPKHAPLEKPKREPSASKRHWSAKPQNPKPKPDIGKAATPATVKAAKPAVVNDSKPATVKAAKPATVKAAKPAVVNDSKPATVKAAKPATVKAAKPAVVNDSKPATVKAAKPATVKAAKPAVVNDSQPATVKAAKPATIKAAKPAVNDSKPATVKAATPAVVNDSKPATVKAAKPAVVNDSKPAVVKAAKPATVKAATPAVVNDSKPATVMDAKPESREQVSESSLGNSRVAHVAAVRNGVLVGSKRIIRKHGRGRKAFRNGRASSLERRPLTKEDLALPDTVSRALLTKAKPSETSFDSAIGALKEAAAAKSVSPNPDTTPSSAGPNAETIASTTEHRGDTSVDPPTLLATTSSAEFVGAGFQPSPSTPHNSDPLNSPSTFDRHLHQPGSPTSRSSRRFRRQWSSRGASSSMSLVVGQTSLRAGLDTAPACVDSSHLDGFNSPEDDDIPKPLNQQIVDTLRGEKHNEKLAGKTTEHDMPVISRGASMDDSGILSHPISSVSSARSSHNESWHNRVTAGSDAAAPASSFPPAMYDFSPRVALTSARGSSIHRRGGRRGAFSPVSFSAALSHSTGPRSESHLPSTEPPLPDDVPAVVSTAQEASGSTESNQTVSEVAASPAPTPALCVVAPVSTAAESAENEARASLPNTSDDLAPPKTCFRSTGDGAARSVSVGSSMPASRASHRHTVARCLSPRLQHPDDDSIMQARAIANTAGATATPAPITANATLVSAGVTQAAPPGRLTVIQHNSTGSSGTDVPLGTVGRMAGYDYVFGHGPSGLGWYLLTQQPPQYQQYQVGAPSHEPALVNDPSDGDGGRSSFMSSTVGSHSDVGANSDLGSEIDSDHGLPAKLQSSGVVIDSPSRTSSRPESGASHTHPQPVTSVAVAPMYPPSLGEASYSNMPTTQMPLPHHHEQQQQYHHATTALAYPHQPMSTLPAPFPTSHGQPPLHQHQATVASPVYHTPGMTQAHSHPGIHGTQAPGIAFHGSPLPPYRMPQAQQHPAHRGHLSPPGAITSAATGASGGFNFPPPSSPSSPRGMAGRGFRHPHATAGQSSFGPQHGYPSTSHQISNLTAAAPYSKARHASHSWQDVRLPASLERTPGRRGGVRDRQRKRLQKHGSSRSPRGGSGVAADSRSGHRVSSPRLGVSAPRRESGFFADVASPASTGRDEGRSSPPHHIRVHSAGSWASGSSSLNADGLRIGVADGKKLPRSASQRSMASLASSTSSTSHPASHRGPMRDGLVGSPVLLSRKRGACIPASETSPFHSSPGRIPHPDGVFPLLHSRSGVHMSGSVRHDEMGSLSASRSSRGRADSGAGDSAIVSLPDSAGGSAGSSSEARKAEWEMRVCAHMAEMLSKDWVMSHPRFRQAFAADGFVKLSVLVSQGRSRALVRSASEALAPLRSHPDFDVMEHVSKNASIALIRHRQAWQELCDSASKGDKLPIEDTERRHELPFVADRESDRDLTA